MAMNQYLQDLLKETKTIIIPGLGALTITNESTGEIMFMSYLKFDDGTLVKHVSNAEGVDADEAKSRIAKFVNEVNIVLDSGASFQLKNFGSFKKADGEIVFEKGDDNAVTTSAPTITEETKIEEPVAIVEPEPEITQPADSEPEIEPVPIAETSNTNDLDSILDNPITQQAEDAPVESVKPEPEPEPEAPINDIVEPVITDVNSEAEKPEVILEQSEPEISQEQNAVVQTPVVEELIKSSEPVVEKKKIEETPEKVDVKKTETKKKKTTEDKPKKKTGVFAYILYGFVVIILGAGTYIAINFNDLKKDFPILADLAGENEAIADTTDLKELTNENDEITSDTMPEAEPIPSETVEQPEVTIPETAPEPAPEPAPQPKPVSKPKPVVKPVSKPVTSPKPVSKPSNSNKSFPQPDLSKPFHIIAGSFSSEANAKRLAGELKSKGMGQVSIGEQGGMYRVSIKGFATKEEANAALPSVQSSATGAWVYNWK